MQKWNSATWITATLFASTLAGADFPSIEKKTEGMKHHKSFVNFYTDTKSGELFLEFILILLHLHLHLHNRFLQILELA